MADCQSPEMQRVYQLVSRVAPTDLDVLITGEPGSGKETVARRIHGESARAGSPFVKVPKSLLQASQLEANLLGVRSSLSDWQRRPENSGMTLYFDEIADLDPEDQTALLQIAVDRESKPAELGDRPLKGPRILAATSRDLWRESELGNFRKDLFLRLSAVEIHVPPLRQHPEDIPQLLAYFLEDRRGGRGGSGLLEKRHYDVLSAYAWPGNIRELALFVRRMLLTGDDADTSIDLLVSRKAAGEEASSETLSLGEAARLASQTVERHLISRALEESGWNRRRASQRLQISYRALLDKIKRLEL